MNRPTIAACVGVLVLLCACGQDVRKEHTGMRGVQSESHYRLTERYEIVGGPREGMKGESAYTVTLRRLSDDRAIEIENFANEYSVRAQIRGDSLFISPQKFAYYDDSVTIAGAGRLSADSLWLEYMSGGPAGQIKCRSTGASDGR